VKTNPSSSCSSSAVVAAIASALVAPACSCAKPRPPNSCPTLPTACVATPASRSSSRWQREVAAVARALEGAGRPVEGTRDHASDGVLPHHQPAHACAESVQLLRRQRVGVRGDLEDGVLRGVDDQRAVAQRRLAVLVDHGDPVDRRVAEHLTAARPLDQPDHLGREAVGIGRARLARDDAHQLPVAGRRVLAGPERVQAAVERRRARRRDALQRQDRAEPEPLHPRQLQTAGQLGQMGERGGARVAVVGRVGQRARADGVEHDDDCASCARTVDPWHGRGG
jgi:hypothetical protein